MCIRDRDYVVSSIFNAAHNTPQLNSVQGWSAQTNNTSQFIGMLFDEPLGISSVTTQGRANANQWVTSYQLEATKDGVTWESLGTYSGNNDRSTQVTNEVSNTDTDWVGLRINPLTWVGHVSLRFGFNLGVTPVNPDVDLDRENDCLLYTSPSPRDATLSRMPSSA